MDHRHFWQSLQFIIFLFRDLDPGLSTHYGTRPYVLRRALKLGRWPELARLYKPVVAADLPRGSGFRTDRRALVSKFQGPSSFRQSGLLPFQVLEIGHTSWRLRDHYFVRLHISQDSKEGCQCLSQGSFHLLLGFWEFSLLMQVLDVQTQMIGSAQIWICEAFAIRKNVRCEKSSPH